MGRLGGGGRFRLGFDRRCEIATHLEGSQQRLPTDNGGDVVVLAAHLQQPAVDQSGQRGHHGELPDSGELDQIPYAATTVHEGQQGPLVTTERRLDPKDYRHRQDGVRTRDHMGDRVPGSLALRGLGHDGLGGEANPDVVRVHRFRAEGEVTGRPTKQVKDTVEGLLGRGLPDHLRVDGTRFDEQLADSPVLVHSGHGGFQGSVVHDAGADEATRQGLTYAVCCCASYEALGEVHDSVGDAVVEPQTAGLLREAEELEDVGKAECVDRAFELHLNSSLLVGVVGRSTGTACLLKCGSQDQPSPLADAEPPGVNVAQAPRSGVGWGTGPAEALASSRSSSTGSATASSAGARSSAVSRAG